MKEKNPAKSIRDEQEYQEKAKRGKVGWLKLRKSNTNTTPKKKKRKK